MKQFQQSAMQNFNMVQKRLESTSQSLKQFGHEATRAFTLPIALAGGVAVKTFTNYETALAHIVGLTGTSAKLTMQWSEELQKLGSSMGQTPQKLADALYFIASSGIEDAYAMDVLTESAKAATAGLGEVADIADLVTGALNAYGPENITAAQTVDALTAAVREGKAEATEMAHAIGFVIPNAAQMGISFDQVAASLAAMTAVNIKTNTAAWYLRQILMNLLKPSQQAEDALSSFGTSSAHLRDVIKEPNGLLKALGEINDLTVKFGEDAVAKVFPEVRALTGFLALMGKNLEHNKLIFDLVANSAGDTDYAFNVVSETLKFQFNQAVSDLRIGLIALGKSMKESLIPIIQGFREQIMKLTEWYTNLTETQQKWILRIGALLAIIGPVSIALGTLLSIFARLIPVISAITSTVTLLISTLAVNPFVALGLALATLTAYMISYKGSLFSARDAQKEFNNEIEKFQKQRQDITYNKSAEQIKKLIGVYTELGKTQLEILSTNIKKQIDLFQSSGADIIALKKAEQKKLKELEEQYTVALGIENSLRFSDRRKEFREAEEITKKYVAKINEQKKQLYEIGYQQFANDKELQEYENAYKRVIERIEKLQKNILSEGGNIKPIYTEAQLDVLKKLEEGEKTLSILSRLLGSDFDYLTERSNLLNAILREMAEARFPELDKNMVNTKNEIKDLNKQISIEYETLKKLGKELQGLQTVEFVTGKSTGAEQLQAYKKTLEELAVAGNLSVWSMIYLSNQIAMLESQFGETAQAQKELNEQWKRVGLGLGTSLADQYQIIYEKIQLINSQIDLLKSKEFITTKDIEDIEKYNSQLKNLEAQLQALDLQKQVFQIIGQSIVQMTDQMGSALAEGASVFDVFAESILSTAQKVIQTLLMEAIATLYLTGASKGLLGLAAASIGVSFLLASFKKLRSQTQEVAKMAGGGKVPPGYPNDTYPALLSSGEVVTPPDKLDSLIGRAHITVEVVGVAKGEDLHYVMKQVEKRYKNSF
jgi:TP901 family phage tail tape measure protein